MVRFFQGGLALMIILSGCVAVPPERRPADPDAVVAPKAGPDFPVRLAILPFSNSSGNPDAGVIVRAMVINKLGHDLGFIVHKPEEVDDILRSRSLEDAAVPLSYILSKTPAPQLAAWLGVDGLLYGDVRSFEKVKVSFYSTAQVKGHFYLVDATGKKLWEADKGSDQGGFGSGSLSLASVLSDSNISADAMAKIQASDVSGSALTMVGAAFASFPTRN